MLYSVGDAAKRIGVSPSTLRYYDREGLLPFVERSGGGMRVFKEEDFEWLQIIECLKRTGLSIKEIREFIEWCTEGDSTIDKRLALIDRQRTIVYAQMQKLKETLHLLDYKHWYYETAQKAGTCSVHDRLSESAVPAEFRDVLQKE